MSWHNVGVSYFLSRMLLYLDTGADFVCLGVRPLTSDVKRGQNTEAGPGPISGG